jgi:hypothetical protein
MKKITFICFLLFTVVMHAQLQGKIIDGTTKESIPFVNIWVLNKDKGTTADENGKYMLAAAEATDTLLFSAVGYADTKIKVTDLKPVTELPQQTIQLDELVITPRKNQHTRIVNPIEDIDEPHFAAATASYNPMMRARFIPYKKEYEATPFLKELLFYTYSDKKNTIYYVRIYSANNDGSPGALLHDDRLMGKAPKGKQMSVVDVSHLNIRIPEKGLFIAIEWLLVQRNEFLVYHTGSKKGQIYYNPRFVNSYVPKKEAQWVFNNGTWKNEGVFNKRFYSIAVEVTLSD